VEQVSASTAIERRSVGFESTGKCSVRNEGRSKVRTDPNPGNSELTHPRVCVDGRTGEGVHVPAHVRD